jgi:hypothetical protein
LLVVIAVAACGNGGGNVDPDASDVIDTMVVDMPPPGPCWPVEGTTPSGVIQLGTGEDFFSPMPDDLPVVFGPQSGYHMPVHARVTGLVPGNPSDVLDPSNPRTRFRAFFVDTGEPVNPAVCPIRIPYEPSGSDFDLISGTAILFEVGLPEAEIFGREIRIVVEVIDAQRAYATAEKVVTCRPPQ